MAYDRAVDSVTLNKSLTYTADRIRAKTGGTAQISFDATKGFGDAVDEIQTGGNVASIWELMRTFQISPNVTATEIVANIPNVTTLSGCLTYCRNTNIKKVELTVSDKLTDLSKLSNNIAPIKLEEIIFHGDLSKVTNMNLAFACGGTGASGTLRKITGLDFSSVTNATNAFASQWGLADLEIKADTVNVSLGIDSKSLSADSCVNLLNALKDRTDLDALTLTCKEELKNATTGKLYIYYTKQDTDTGLYVSCKQTDDGAMTIAAAITAKNWTIA